MNREERFQIRWLSNKDGEWHTLHCKGKEAKDRNVAKCKANGIRYTCKKLYPFSTNKNQHNFELISNICFCDMQDMIDGEKEWDEAEFDRLQKMEEKAQEFFCLPLPVAWLPYEEWKEAKELATMACLHREAKCIESGRIDLLRYCEEGM